MYSKDFYVKEVRMLALFSGIAIVSDQVEIDMWQSQRLISVIFEHQFFIWNKNFSIDKCKQAVYNHGRINLVSTFQLHDRSRELIYFRIYAFTVNH